MLRGVVSRPLHLAAKQTKPDAFCRTPFRGSAVCNHQPSSDALIGDHHEVHRQVERLSAAHLQTSLHAARCHSLDLDTAVEEYKRSRHLDLNTDFSLPKDSFTALDGKHLDAIFNLNQKRDTSISSLDQLTDLFLCSASSFLYKKTDNAPSKKSSAPLALPDDCVMYCSGGPTPGSEDSDLPNSDVLNNVHDYFLEGIPSMVNARVDPNVYSNDIVLINNFNPAKPKVVAGGSNYFLYMSKMRAYVHLKYAKARLSVVRSWQDPVKGTVRFQWRLSTISQLQAMMFWRFSFWNMEGGFAKYAKNLEAVSTFHVNKEGQIYKHVVDRVIADGEETVKKSMNPLENLVKKAAPSMV